MKPEQLAEALDLAADTPDRVLADRVPKLVAEVKRLTAELELAFSPGMYLDIQKVLDEALGTKESDGAGAGIVADVALLADRMKTALAERDELRQQVDTAEDRRAGAVLRERQALAELDQSRQLLKGSRAANDHLRAERDAAQAALQRERHQTKALLSDTADALEDLGACDDYECEKEDCTGILLRIRAALVGSGT